MSAEGTEASAAAASVNYSFRIETQSELLVLEWDGLELVQMVSRDDVYEYYEASTPDRNLFVKRLRLEVIPEPDVTAFVQDFVDEMSLWNELAHQNIVPLMGACTVAPNLAMITERMEGGSVHHLLFGMDRKCSFLQKVDIIQQIGKGMLYLHTLGIRHGNLNLRKIDLNGSQTVFKINDFSKASVCADPSMLLGDIWALGAVMVEVLLQFEWLADDYERYRDPIDLPQDAKRVLTGYQLPDDFLDVVCRCVSENPAARPEAMKDICLVLFTLSSTAWYKQLPRGSRQTQ